MIDNGLLIKSAACLENARQVKLLYHESYGFYVTFIPPQRS